MNRFFTLAIFSLFLLMGVTTDVYAQDNKKKKKEDVIVMAQFKGGQEALVDYLLQNTRYHNRQRLLREAWTSRHYRRLSTSRTSHR